MKQWTRFSSIKGDGRQFRKFILRLNKVSISLARSSTFLCLFARRSSVATLLVHITLHTVMWIKWIKEINLFQFMIIPSRKKSEQQNNTARNKDWIHHPRHQLDDLLEYSLYTWKKTSIVNVIARHRHWISSLSSSFCMQRVAHDNHNEEIDMAWNKCRKIINSLPTL